MDYNKIIQNAAADGGMLDVLLALQSAEGSLSEAALRATAAWYHLPPSAVWETATFYGMLRTAPRKRHTVEVCQSTCCHAAQADRLMAELREALAARTDVELCRCECLGRCDTAPNAVVDGKLVENATPGRVKEALKEVASA